MKKSTTSFTSRRDVLKGGAAVLGLGVAGLPMGGAFAAVTAAPPRPSIASPTGQAMLKIYEKAVGLMKTPSLNKVPHPLSWTFQAYIHALPIDPSDPNSKGYTNGSAAFKAKVDSIYGKAPTGQVAKWKEAALACWSTCPHGSSYFLPWHRWYMFYFEEVIRAVAKRPDFSLPYWAYGSNENSSLQLPAAFQNPASPLYEAIRGDGFTNPLNLVSQTQPMNKNGYLGYPLVDYSGSLVATDYFPADAGGDLSFPPAKEWYAYGYTGRTETQPHDNVHDGVGGLMGNVPTAAHDPIFYMHHCQIDHLWGAWQSYSSSTVNFAPSGQGQANQPSQDQWNSTQFYFVDGAGTLVTVQAKNAVDYRALGYSYDSLPPQPGAGLVAGTAATKQVVADASQGKKAPLAAQAGVTVGSGGTTVVLAPALTAKAGEAANAVAPSPKTLVLRDVTLNKRPRAALYVFLNLPQGMAAEVGGAYYLGPVNLFKLNAGKDPEAGDTADHTAHRGHGMNSAAFTYDVEKLLAEQRQKGLWTGGPLSVTITTAGAKGLPGETYLSVGVVELAE